MIIAVFDDEKWPKTKINHIRHTSRVILMDENGEYIYHHIVGEDDFGKRNHLESVGGGVERGEDLISALKREVLEEVGMEAFDIKPLGTIIDRYYHIGRETHSHYFVARVDTTKMQETSRTEEEKLLFQDVLVFNEEEVLPYMEHNTYDGVNTLVHRREYVAFKYYVSVKEEKLSK